MKENFITDNSAKLAFSSDTILFDTVLTPLATASKVLMIYNPYSKSVKISSLQLAGGSSSFYKINVNGRNGTSFADLEIFPHDSMYIFVAAKLDQIGQDKPLLIRDSILCYTNGNQQKILLICYGQDVTIIKNTHLQTQTWTSDKPYLLFDTVTLDVDQTLTIEAGTRVYLYNNASLKIYGSLKVNGETNHRVLFHHTRMENEYYNQAGQWGKILLMASSKENVIDNCDIWSPVTGIEIGEADQNAKPDLLIRNSMIINAKNSLVMAFGATITAENCVFANSGDGCVTMFKGGKYKFYHCTIYNGGISSTRAVRRYKDFHYSDTVKGYSGILDSILVLNTIIYGNSPDVSIYSTSSSGYYFKNSILNADWKVFNKNDSQHFDSIISEFKEKLLKQPHISNEETDELKYDFMPDSLSDARGKASYGIALRFPIDLKGNNRLVNGKPDIGALQWQPEKK